MSLMILLSTGTDDSYNDFWMSHFEPIILNALAMALNKAKKSVGQELDGKPFQSWTRGTPSGSSGWTAFTEFSYISFTTIKMHYTVILHNLPFYTNNNIDATSIISAGLQ